MSNSMMPAVSCMSAEVSIIVEYLLQNGSTAEKIKLQKILVKYL